MGEEEVGKLFIGGVDKSTTNEEFEELFKSKGEIEDIILMKDPNMPYRNRGFGFVRFKDPARAEAILNSSEEIHLGGKKLDIKACRQRDSQPKQDNTGQIDSPNKIFVGGLPQSCSQAVLEQTFSAYGEVQHVKIMTDRHTGNLRGFAFVTFATAEPVRKLIEERFVQCDGKSVECKAAEHRYRFQGPDARGGGYPFNAGQGGGYGNTGGGGGGWQPQGGQGDAFQYNNAGGWGAQQQMGGVWGQQTPMGNYNTQGGYGRGQNTSNQWNPGYGGGYGSNQQSGAYGGGYGTQQTQGYGDQYSQGAGYGTNQGYSGGYGGGYGTTQPQQGGYGATGYSTQGGYGGGYANNSNAYGQQTQQQQAPLQDPNSSGGPMRSGHGQRVGNNTHGYHPYGK